tara:strand:- start:5633 stop:5926 length:294 start_codon:yes stop_codon:yes gene_type:complete
MSDTEKDPITLTQVAEEETPAPAQPETREVPIVDIPINSHNTALNILVALTGVAQKRGAFNIQESAKLWECIQAFNTPAAAPPAAPPADDEPAPASD